MASTLLTAALAPRSCCCIPSARASAVSSATHVSVSPPAVLTRQLLSRLDALRKSASTAASATAVGADSRHSAAAAGRTAHGQVLENSAPVGSNFRDCHARLQHWWIEHLEDRAAMVQLACHPALDGTEEAEEVETFSLKRPVLVDWTKDVYPPASRTSAS